MFKMNICLVLCVASLIHMPKYGALLKSITTLSRTPFVPPPSAKKTASSRSPANDETGRGNRLDALPLEIGVF
jgi:hypothetical protein